MRYLLDTNTCIYIIKRKPEAVLSRLLETTPGDAGISAVTLSELQYGVGKSERRDKSDSVYVPLARSNGARSGQKKAPKRIDTSSRVLYNEITCRKVILDLERTVRLFCGVENVHGPISARHDMLLLLTQDQVKG